MKETSIKSDTHHILEIQSKKFQPTNSSKIRKALLPINLDKELTMLRRLNGEMVSNVNHLIDPIKKISFLLSRKSSPSSSRNLLTRTPTPTTLRGNHCSSNRLHRSKTPLSRTVNSASLLTASASPVKVRNQNAIAMHPPRSVTKFDRKEVIQLYPIEGILQNCSEIEAESIKEYSRLEVMHNDSGRYYDDLKLRLEAMSNSPKKLTDEDKYRINLLKSQNVDSYQLKPEKPTDLHEAVTDFNHFLRCKLKLKVQSPSRNKRIRRIKQNLNRTPINF